MPKRTAWLPALAALAAAPLAAQVQNQTQGLTLPLASPPASVSQRIGLTDVRVDYHRPAVNEREIWGSLVPYGQVWRTGANENTLITFSGDVTIEGQPLAAGTYGLHTLPGESEWVVIFSRDTTAWGSFSYDEANDALRVTVQPEEAPFQERMVFAFDDVGSDSATLALTWEKVRVPFDIAVDDKAQTLASIEEQLKGLPQFFWLGWNQAATYCLQNDVNLEEAVEWADRSIQIEERFENLSTKSQLLAKTGDAEQAAQLMDRALEKANPLQIHNYGRQLLAQNDKERALEVFRLNASRHPEAWFIGVGLARGHAALGQFGEAARHMKVALEKAPEAQKAYIQGLVTQLEQGQNI